MCAYNVFQGNFLIVQIEILSPPVSLSLSLLQTVSVERLSHTVCCLWLQHPWFISFCLLQHNCCQYSREISQENELQ